MTIRISTAARAAQVQAVAALLASGTLEVYEEPRYPESPSVPISDAAKCLLRVPLPERCTVEGDSVVFKDIVEARIGAQGSPTRFRVVAKDGSTVVLDGTCGDAGEDMVLKRDDGGALFYTGMRVQLDEFRHTLVFEG